jgi:hypothetical protein
MMLRHSMSPQISFRAAKRFTDDLLLRHLFAVGLLVFIALFCLTSAQAQTSYPTTSTTDSTTPSGLAPGSPAGSYALNGFETINLYNGDLNFHLPLVHIGGRGSAGYTMTLTFDSKRWRTRDFPHTDTYGNEYDVFKVNDNSPMALSVGYTPGVLQGRQSGISIYKCSSGSMFYAGYTLTTLTFTAADGTEYGLRDQNSNGQPHYSNGTVCTSSGYGYARGTTFSTRCNTTHMANWRGSLCRRAARLNMI